MYAELCAYPGLGVSHAGMDEANRVLFHEAVILETRHNKRRVTEADFCEENRCG